MSDKNQGLRRLINHVDESASSTIHIAEATVTEVRKRDKKVKLTTLPEGEEIGWVRMLVLGGDGAWSTTILPPVGSTVVVLFPGGKKDMAVCLTGNLLEAGEVGSELASELDIIIADSRGNKISLLSGEIKIEATNVKVNATNVTINDGVLPVARQTDTVASPFGTLFITRGNTAFLA